MPIKVPGVPKQPKPAKRIRVTIGDGNADFQGKANIQKAVRANAPQSPKFTPAIKTVLDAWSAVTDQAVTQYNAIINAEAALEQMYGTVGNVLLQVGLARDAFVTSVENVCATAADATSFGVNAVVPGKHVEPVAPAAIRVIATGVPGTDRIRWPSQPGAASYVAEQSVDPPTPASWTPSYTGMSPFFTLTGTPGQKLWVRICSVGKAPSAWSDPFVVIVR